MLSDVTKEHINHAHTKCERLYWRCWTTCAESAKAPCEGVNGTEYVRSCRACRPVLEDLSTSSSKCEVVNISPMRSMLPIVNGGNRGAAESLGAGVSDSAG